jgi:hypothetical protein
MAGLVLRHWATIAPEVESVAEESLAVEVPTIGSASAPFACQITPGTPESVFNDFGIELKRPHMMIVPVSMLSSIQVGARVVMGSRAFSVQAPPQIYSLGLSTDHLTVALEELEFAEGS